MAAVVWFRKGLRLHDNAALVHACTEMKKHDLKHLYPLFILDPWFVEQSTIGANRFAFLLETLTDLNAQLTKMGSRLLVLKGTPATVFPALFKRWDVKLLAFEKDTEPYARQRDAAITKLADEHGVTVSMHDGHTLYDMDAVAAKCKGVAPKTLGSFQKIIDALGPPPAPLPAPPALPPWTSLQLQATRRDWPIDWYEGQGEGEGQLAPVPSLSELGRQDAEHTTPFRGGRRRLVI